MTKSFEDFRDKVDEFQNDWRNSEALKFESNFKDPYDLRKDWKDDRPYPFKGDPGVYAIFGKEEDLIYIGRAQTFEGRFSDYFGYKENGECRIIDPIKTWDDREPRFILAVKVEHYWESALLEEFLIWKLDPPANIKGRKPKKA